MPEPDVAVVCGSRHDYLESHPKTADLVIEVADSSINTDRQKAAIYAEAGVPDFWVLNLAQRRIEVFREPERWGGTWRYASERTFEQGTEIVPLRFPLARIAVQSLLP